MNAVEQAWKAARILDRLDDTPVARKAFYRGARLVLTMMIEAGDNVDLMYKLNDELRLFGTETVAMGV